jgi:acyl-coenzyme A thioesterase PaaI-like protein
MDLKCLEHGPHTVVTMELSDAVRASAPGSVHGGMLATLADAASAFTIWGAFDPGAEIPVTTDLHIRYYHSPPPVRLLPKRTWCIVSVDC